MKVCKKDLRISRDWLGDRWVDIKLKPNLASTIFTVNSSNTKLSVSPSITKVVDSVGVVVSRQDTPVNDKSNELNVVAEDVNCVNDDNKPPSQEEKTTEVDESEVHGCCENENNNDNEDNKEGNDGNDNNTTDTDDNKDMKVFETSGEECKAVELMEVAV